MLSVSSPHLLLQGLGFAGQGVGWLYAAREFGLWMMLHRGIPDPNESNNEFQPGRLDQIRLHFLGAIPAKVFHGASREA